MEYQRNLYEVTYTEMYTGRQNRFTVIAVNEAMAERYCKTWREMFDTAEVELIKSNVVGPFGVRQAFWDC